MNPMSRSQPSPQTQWQTGAYTTSSQIVVNRSTAEKRIRSAKPPTISAGVMMANVNWNMAKDDSGMTPTIESSPTPLNSALPRPPMNRLPSPNAKL